MRAAVWRGPLGFGLLIGGLCVGIGCGQRNTYVAPPPPEVVVMLPIQKNVVQYTDFTGTTRPSEEVRVRSRVSGYLQSIHFNDGDDVSKGDLLFVIDPRPFQAKLDQSRAELESKKAANFRAESLYRRTVALLGKGASTREDVDKDKGDWEVAKASIGEAEAKVREAQLNLDFTEIHGPISGKIGKREADVGNLINADNTVLTTIARYNPMYAYFNATETEHLDYLKRRREHPPGTPEQFQSMPVSALAASSVGLASGRLPSLLTTLGLLHLWQRPYPVEMGTSADETKYPLKGIVDYADLGIDPGTGTLLLRGVFANPEPYALSPGLFVRLRIPITTRANALLVPERALSIDQAGRYLLVVNQDNVVERREVRVGAQVDNLRVVLEGLKPGERFVVEGLQRARPGGTVKPVTAKTAAVAKLK